MELVILKEKGSCPAGDLVLHVHYTNHTISTFRVSPCSHDGWLYCLMEVLWLTTVSGFLHRSRSAQSGASTRTAAWSSLADPGRCRVLRPGWRVYPLGQAVQTGGLLHTCLDVVSKTVRVIIGNWGGGGRLLGGGGGGCDTNRYHKGP